MDIVTITIGVLIAAAIVVYLIINQRTKIKEWLLWAVTSAEKELGGGTGELKLRQVWDWFTSKFPVVAVILPFRVFRAWVDTALIAMRKMLGSNAAAVNYINGGDTYDSN